MNEEKEDKEVSYETGEEILKNLVIAAEKNANKYIFGDTDDSTDRHYKDLA